MKDKFNQRKEYNYKSYISGIKDIIDTSWRGNIQILKEYI